MISNHNSRRGDTNSSNKPSPPNFIPHAPHLSMQSVFPHGAKPQVSLMSSVMVQISHMAKSCMSVLKPTLHQFSPERDNPTTKWQCCSSDATTSAEHGEQSTGSRFMFYMCDYNMFNIN